MVRSDSDVKELMSGNICRCGAYPNIVAAIQARPPASIAIGAAFMEMFKFSRATDVAQAVQAAGRTRTGRHVGSLLAELRCLI